MRLAAACLAIAGLLAACQPLPHPFADDRPPAELLTIRDSAGVSVEPIVGQPEAATGKLAEAVVRALLQRDIPASDKTTGRAARAAACRARNSTRAPNVAKRASDVCPFK